MAKKKDERPGYGKLLDAWTPPPDGGEPVGCFATSFTFDPVFFEEQCLSRFLHLETDPDEHGSAFLIEREEKLAQVRCAAALVDQHWCRGARNPRWSLLSARVPKAILHAKLSLLVWTNRIRFVTASANLTESGYRRNQEVFGSLDYFVGCETPLLPLTEGLAFLESAVQTSEPQAAEPSQVVARCSQFFEHVRTMVTGWKLAEPPVKRSPVRVVPLFTGQGRPLALEQLRELWPNDTPAKSAHVLSPFFDPPDSKNMPAAELWKLLRKRGETDVTYYVTVERATDDAPPFIHAPEALKHSLPDDRPSALVNFAELKLEPGRELHAKGIYLHDDRWIAYMLGSSNFTRAGLGLAGPVNIEANLVYLVDYRADDKLGAAFDVAFPKYEPLDVEAEEVVWQPIPNDDEQVSAEFADLPQAFGAAILDLDAQGSRILRLAIGANPPAGWKVYADTDDVLAEEIVVAEEAKSTARSEAGELVVAWTPERSPSGLWVGWSATEARAWWPINIVNSGVLPPPDDLRNLSLEVLIDILTAARPLHRVMEGYIKRNKNRRRAAATASYSIPTRKSTPAAFSCNGRGACRRRSVRFRSTLPSRSRPKNRSAGDCMGRSGPGPWRRRS